MNRLRFIIPALIQINIVVAILSVVFVLIIREQQAQMTTHTQQSFEKPGIVPRQIKEKIADYKQKNRQNQEKIHSYEQQLKGLQAELKEYKTQNALLMQTGVGNEFPTGVRNEFRTGVLKDHPNHSKQQLNTSVVTKGKQQTIEFSQKPASVKSASKPSTAQPKARVKQGAQRVPQSGTSSRPQPIQSIEIADKYPSSAVDFSVSEMAKQPERITTENIETEVKTIEAPNEFRTEAKDENQNWPNNNNNTIIYLSENPEEFSTNSSEEEITKQAARLGIPFFQSNSNRENSTYYANNIAYGLAVAADEGQINHGTKMYRKVQTAIRLLRQGESKEEATRKAKVPTSVMNQLMQWGEKRPANLLNETKQE